MPKITVVIPLYNKANFIKETLQSVYAQNFTDYEVVVINDGSTDGSEHHVLSLKNEKTKLINQANNGLSNARNTGIEHALGSVICLIDADDIWLPNHLQKIANLIDSYPEAQLYGTAYSELLPNGLLIKPKTNTGFKTTTLLIEDFFITSAQQPFITPSSFGFKKEIIRTIGGFDPTITYAEDTDFFIRANLNYKLAFDATTTCHYRYESENQITRSKLSFKKQPDYAKYLLENAGNYSLKRFINLNYYYLCNSYKAERATEAFIAMRKNVDTNFLNNKQRFLLNAPPAMLNSIRYFKQKMLFKGKRLTSF
ncbi:glycosyltransferase family 2 protein [Leeuwenhoekiella sp. MAR_2009_132]|uniref:glycosyltransferase family 2 protein n=1 Tax=Leeuwenhoekiella sp. MAR_2009_132 TaxID=1392489 RepID=UPI00048DA2EC|nr:glycosyltransferase family A protein [Leeuwenhoekiella sp. MAR_2009_132]